MAKTKTKSFREEVRIIFGGLLVHIDHRKRKKVADREKCPCGPNPTREPLVADPCTATTPTFNKCCSNSFVWLKSGENDKQFKKKIDRQAL